MREVYISKKKIIVNFSKKYCETSLDILKSETFKIILKRFVKIQGNKNEKIRILNKKNQEVFVEKLIEFFQLALVFDVDTMKRKYPQLNDILDKEILYEFLEELYDYWRKLERYSIMFSAEDIDSDYFLKRNNDFTNLVLKTYRQISRNILNEDYNIYRQLPAGVNAGLKVVHNSENLKNQYSILNKIPLIEKILIRPPFIAYTEKNKRDGIFLELKENFITKIDFLKSKFLYLKIMVGTSLAFVYFDIDYLHQIIPIANLFYLPQIKDVKGKKPDIILIFGGKTEIQKPSFYVDNENSIIAGICPYGNDIDYFGYMKKMLLTLHNISLIENDGLPIHGAFVNIEFYNGTKKNICIIGDSGAGKSETLESFRVLAKNNLKSMKIVFDDMGCFYINDNHVYARGTETGAFVRLDDLENGYPYEEIDRSIFINPNQVNSRIVIPVSTYSHIIKEHKIDYCFYANNYYDANEQIYYFNNFEEAKKVFISGRRFAKGTTTEKGLVESYFANPFGPVQRIEKCDILFDNIFHLLFNNGVKIGEIYTKLGILGKEIDGPREAALKLLEHIMSESK